jgi:hypothetical protein
MSDDWRRDVIVFTAVTYALSFSTYFAGWRPLGAAIWAPLIGVAGVLAAELHLTEPEVSIDD